MTTGDTNRLTTAQEDRAVARLARLATVAFLLAGVGLGVILAAVIRITIGGCP